jgi:hypothetical protein
LIYQFLRLNFLIKLREKNPKNPFQNRERGGFRGRGRGDSRGRGGFRGYSRDSRGRGNFQRGRGDFRGRGDGFRGRGDSRGRGRDFRGRGDSRGRGRGRGTLRDSNQRNDFHNKRPRDDTKSDKIEWVKKETNSSERRGFGGRGGRGFFGSKEDISKKRTFEKISNSSTSDGMRDFLNHFDSHSKKSKRE